MIILVLTVCLSAHPSLCIRERPAFVPPFRSAAECMTVGMMQAARWASDRPDYHLVRWDCRPQGI